MSVKLILFVRRRADLTHAQFKARYESGHAPLARRSLPLLRRYVRNFLSTLPGHPEPEYDCVTEFWFDSMADMEATGLWAASDEGQVLAIDEAEFMDRASMRTFIAEEAVLPGETPPWAARPAI
jgi:uncharacterized protein (TIGR02118 family)